jgi:hypothetical protein
MNMVDTQKDCSTVATVEQVDQFGRVVADIVYIRWCSGACTPLWREVFKSPEVSNLPEKEGFSDLHPLMESLMRRAAGRGWLVYSGGAQVTSRGANVPDLDARTPPGAST